MPMAVFLVGTLFGTEAYTGKRMANMIVVTIGVAIAAYGEINFVLTGVILQLISIAVEATRLTMVQVGSLSVKECDWFCISGCWGWHFTCCKLDVVMSDA